MTTAAAPPPAPPPTPLPASRPATPAQLAWLGREVRAWAAEGLLAEDEAERILHRYHATRRFSLARLMLALGAAFVGVGLVWLVAANLDALPPLVRIAVVAAIWLAALATGELLADRGPSPVLAGAARLFAALAFGAVVFQAAQSLQVPAYEPRLVGVWGAGALLHAYAVRARGPLLVGLLAGTGWYVWQLTASSPSVLTAVLGLGTAAVLAVSLAALHDAAGRSGFAEPWRAVGALLALVVLFIAALPFAGTDDFSVSGWLLGGLVASGAVAALALGRAAGDLRLEPLGALATVALSVALVAWDTGNDADRLTVADWAHAGVSVAAYVVLAVGVAALGVLRDNAVLTALAAAGLVVFTTFQSFAVFARIIQGAWLFLVLGLVFLATGYLFDRARRRLAASLEGDAR